MLRLSRWRVLGLLAAAVTVAACRRATPAPPSLTLVTVVDGAAASDVERLVSVPLEQALAGLAARAHVSSLSTAGLSLVTVELAPGTDTTALRALALERVTHASLPAGASPTLAVDDNGAARWRYTLTSNTRTGAEVRALEDWMLERAARTVPGVRDVIACGGSLRQINVEPDPERLAAYDVALGDLAHALAGPPSSALRYGWKRVEDIGAAVIAERRGVPVRVQDVAVVRESNVPAACHAARDGHQVVAATVIVRAAERSQVAQARAEVLGKLRLALPPDVTLLEFSDGTGGGIAPWRVRVELPPGLSYFAARDTMERLAREVERVPEVTSVLEEEHFLDENPQSQAAALAPGDVPGEASLWLALKPAASWRRSVRDEKALVHEIARLLAPVPGARLGFDGVPGLAHLDVRLAGPDPATLDRLAHEVQALLDAIPGTMGAMILDGGEVPRIDVRPERTALARLGLDVNDVEDAIAIARGGRVVSQLFEGERRVDVRLRAPGAADELAQLRAVTLRTHDGTRVPLSAVATLAATTDRRLIARRDGARVVTVRTTLVDVSVDDALAQARRQVNEKLQLPPGYLLTLAAAPN